MESKDNTQAQPDADAPRPAEEPPSNVTEDVIHGFHFPHAEVKLKQQKTP